MGVSYSEIIQLRDWLPDAIGGIAWFSFDNPGQSPRIPIYSGANRATRKVLTFCGQKRYREDAAIWQYRKANKLATLEWQSTKKGLLDEVAYFEEKGQTENKRNWKSRLEKLLKAGKKKEAQNLLNKYTKDFTGATMLRWKELEEKYWARFGLGF